MQIDLDRSSHVSLYRQISESIRRSILLNQLPGGYRLPSERRMAARLGVNRATVVTAYRELQADGLVRGEVGRGTLVSQSEPQIPGAPARMRWCTMKREDVPAQDGVVREFFECAQRTNAISMSLGLPAPELIPVELLGELRARVVRDFGAAPFMPAALQGLEELRGLLAERLRMRGVACGPAQVVLAAGAQQAIEVVVRAYVEPGDYVCVEAPCCASALRLFRSAGAKLIATPVDAEGINTDVLAAHLQRRQPKLIYVRPTFQNPTGASMSAARRRQLLELARRHDVPLLEHDGFFDLRYSGDFVPPLKALDEGRFVIYLDSFPRLISPEFGVAALVAAPEVARKLAAEKSCAVVDANPLGQWLLAEFLRGGHYDPHMALLRRAYATRLTALLEGLQAGGDAGLSWNEPQGGLYLWCRLPRGLDEKSLRETARDRGVSYLPGAFCSVAGEASEGIRLSFACPTPAEISAGAARLLDAVRTVYKDAGPV